MTTSEPLFSLLGTSAVLFEAPGQAMTLEVQQRIWSLAKQASQWPEVHEAVPGMNNLMLAFQRPPRDIDGLRRKLALLAGYMVAILGTSGTVTVSLGLSWWIVLPAAYLLAAQLHLSALLPLVAAAARGGVVAVRVGAGPVVRLIVLLIVVLIVVPVATQLLLVIRQPQQRQCTKYPQKTRG